MMLRSITLLVIAVLHSVKGCQFYPPGEYLRFVRVPENLRVGEEVLRIEVYPRNNLSLKPVDKDEDVHYFTYRDFNRTTVSLLLARSLEDLVDSDNPRNVLKFKVSCDYDDGEDIITSSLSVTVYVEDVNDHAPVFVGAPYQLAVDELTPVGLTIFRGIRASDRDKPNTPNSDVQYVIISGNERGKFALDSSQQAFLILKRPLDYDTGDREFLLTIAASDRGIPPRSTNTTIRITVNDNDDLSPKFTKGVYRTRINEFYPITGERIHKLLTFDPPIHAFDQDIAIDAPIRYDIIAGNERHIFSLDHVNGSLFIEREIDIDSERSLPGNTFVLQIQASQVDNPAKTGVARVEVEIMDLNDNLPEFEVDFYNISIVENLPNGFSVLQIIAVDQDQGDNAEFSYQLEDNTGAFTLDSRTGWLTVRDQSVLDREKRSTLRMQVYAKEKVPSVVNSKLGASAVNIEVTLLDANDNNPTFIPNNLYNFITNSDLKIGDVVGQIHAIDPDLGRNGMVTYSIQKAPNNSVPFKVDPKSGKISVNQKVVPPGRHLLFVEASDQPLNPSERRSSLAVVTIEVQPQTSKGTVKGLPDFVGAPYEFWVGGNVGVGTSVGQIRVADVPDRRTLIYDLLHSYHEGVPFAVEERSGTITVVDNLENYNRQNYEFEAVVTNEKEMTLVTNVTIHVVDPKDEKTILMKAGTAPIEFHVKENAGNLLIGRLGFKNANSSGLVFSIANQKDVTDHISITSDGSLYTVKPLDRETRDVYRLTVLAEYSKGAITGTGIYQVTIHVDDENDNKPTFEHSKYEGKVTENCISGTEVDLNYLIHVSDKDTGDNGQFSVTIFGNGSEKFRLDRNTGKIFFTSSDSPLDREETSVFNLRLVAKDQGGLYDEAILIIMVEDENDNSPTFVQFIVYDEIDAEIEEYDKLGNRIGHFEPENSTKGTYVLTPAYIRAKKAKGKMSPLIILKEDISVGTPVIKLVAEDRDFGDNAVVKYEMVSETYIPNEYSAEPFHLTQYFMVHSTNGEISVSRTLPPESEFRLNISASDKGGLKDHISVRLTIEDVNDHPPVFSKSWYNFDAEEASYSRNIIGRVEAIDGDFGPNANITYKIQEKDPKLPFAITPQGGVLTIDGVLDRETKDKYNFVVVAKDNPTKGESLSSFVNVEVNVLDVNDNPPSFYGYDDLLPNPESNTYSNHNYQENIPVYYATVAENSPIGTPVTRIFANDSDFTGNGNGLLLFDIPLKKNRQNLFTIDSKEGIVTTIGKLDFENQNMHNITIVASDLGSPSLSSTALLVVTVIDVPEDLQSMEHPVFAHRYYEVEVEENVPVPLKVLTLNVTESYRTHKLKYSIVAEKNSDVRKTFRIDPRNGTLYIIESPDREKKALYELIIRLEQYKVGRDMTVMVYPVTNERLGNLGLNEVKVIIRITDVNDNIPKFTITGRPIIAAIPTTASYGHHILRLQAKDPDLGLNGEVRYQILGRADEAARRFTIDPITGQVRAIANFARDAGKVYGFDVKATDRRGADDGKSSIANVFVYVLDDQKQLVMVMGLKPTDVERHIENITLILHNTTGYDIRIRKLEPHSERNQIDNSATDMYLYAVDPILNVVVDMEQLQKVLQLKTNEIEHQLQGPKVLAVASGVSERGHSRNQRVILSSLEVGVVVLGCVVFIGALATAICVMCARRRKRRLLQKSFAQPLGYPIGTLGKPSLFPASFGDLHYTDSGHDIVHHHHDRSCQRMSSTRRTFRERSRSSGCIEKSITSLHSSGQDSGIVDAGHCQCRQSCSQSSEESSNYEDSLQSVPQKRTRSASIRQVELNSARNTQQRRSRNRSISEDIVQSAGLHRMRSLGHIPAPPPMAISGPSTLRRSSDRLIVG
ncbi:cadherin-89D isoform X1 [Tribolium madens]|uniref:cadherin-89D isoform X1 n=1 Tax=Tribolium madens TaxID=41895 RepID=UPI001CF72E4E|nr:cadherin-89D isoform X1 [Tribolium madens]